MTQEDAATRPKRKAYALPPDPDSLRQRCMVAGLCDSAVHKWRDRHPGSPLTDDEVIAAIVANKEARRLTKERKARCEALGYVWSTIRSRMERERISFEEAISRPLTSRQEQGRRNRHHIRKGGHPHVD